MKMKVSKAFSVTEPFGMLMQKDMPADTAYALKKMSLKFDEEMKTINDMRVKILDEFGVSLGSDNRYDIAGFLKKAKKKDADEFNRKWTELMDVEITIDVKPISVKRLVGVNIRPDVLMALEDFITD